MHRELLPHVITSRNYDYLLGGKDHFAADRPAGEKALLVKPEAKASPRENRAFLTGAMDGRIVNIADEAPLTIYEIAQIVDSTYESSG